MPQPGDVAIALRDIKTTSGGRVFQYARGVLTSTISKFVVQCHFYGTARYEVVCAREYIAFRCPAGKLKRERTYGMCKPCQMCPKQLACLARR